MELTKRKLLDEFNISTHKSITFLYTSNEYIGTEIKNTVLFTITPKKTKPHFEDEKKK